MRLCDYALYKSTIDTDIDNNLTLALSLTLTVEGDCHADSFRAMDRCPGEISGGGQCPVAWWLLLVCGSLCFVAELTDDSHLFIYVLGAGVVPSRPVPSLSVPRLELTNHENGRQLKRLPGCHSE